MDDGLTRGVADSDDARKPPPKRSVGDADTSLEATGTKPRHGEDRGPASRVFSLASAFGVGSNPVAPIMLQWHCIHVAFVLNSPRASTSSSFRAGEFVLIE